MYILKKCLWKKDFVMRERVVKGRDSQKMFVLYSNENRTFTCVSIAINRDSFLMNFEIWSLRLLKECDPSLKILMLCFDCVNKVNEYITRTKSFIIFRIMKYNLADKHFDQVPWWLNNEHMLIWKIKGCSGQQFHLWYILLGL